MGIHRKTAGYAASRIVNDTKTQQELRELFLRSCPPTRRRGVRYAEPPRLEPPPAALE